MTDLIIEPAAQRALAACFALLPNLASPDTRVFTARDAHGVLLGAAGLLWRSWGRNPGLPCWITVLPDRRRSGVGMRLLQAIASIANHEQFDLVGAEPTDEDGPAASFARTCGAIPDSRQLFFEADARNFLDGIQAVVSRLDARGRIPPEARVIPLHEAPADEVKWLVVQEMAAAPPMVEDMLTRSANGPPESAPIDLARSCVLMVGEQLAGALLTRRKTGRGAAMIVCNVVAPQWRGGWANALLLQRFTHRTIEAGCFNIAFDCGDDVRDTIGLARRSSARQIAVRTRFRYAATSAAAFRR
jgi:GNAT superfamily N-acetyltransferase